jgi:hypothetical protein
MKAPRLKENECQLAGRCESATCETPRMCTPSYAA